MAKLEQEFPKGKYVDAAATIIYAGANDKYFYDAAKTEANEVAAADIFELFVNGVLVVNASSQYVRPVACT